MAVQHLDPPPGAQPEDAHRKSRPARSLTAQARDARAAPERGPEQRERGPGVRAVQRQPGPNLLPLIHLRR